MSWLCVAEELFHRRGPGSVRFLAPDLRGRADSRSAPGPYGLGTHAADVLAIADVFGARPVLVGHSMGAFVTALASSRAPERVAGSVLVDGGFAFPPPAEFDIDAALTAVIGPAMTRLSMRFASPEAYLDFWRVHPALGPELSGPQAPEVRRYALHDLVEDGRAGSWVSSCVLDGRSARTVPMSWPTRRRTRRPPARSPPVCRLSSSGHRADCRTRPRGSTTRLASPRWGCRRPIRVTPLVDVNHYTAVFASNGTTAVVDAIERRLDRTAAGVSAA